MTDSLVAQISASRRPIALVLTAIASEADAVAAHLSNTQQVTIGQWVLDWGEFVGKNIEWQVVLLESGPGNVPAAASLAQVAAKVDPDIVMFVGVAGGLKDVKLGDVVVGTKVYSVHSGKAGERFQPRPVLECADLHLEQRAKAVRRQGTWVQRIQGPRDLTPNDPTAFIAPLAAGDNVVSSDRSAMFEFVREYYSDALAFEMEGYGFLAAARYSGCPALVIRGISDLCAGKDESDAKGWQPRAVAHAAAFAFELLANCTPPPRLQLSPSPFLPDGNSGTVKDSTASAGSVARGGGDSHTSNIRLPSVDEIISRFERCSLSLVSRKIASDHWIARPEEWELRRVKDGDVSRVRCLLGVPGSGKTAMLAKFAAEAAETGLAVLAIKADLIPVSESFEAWGRRQLDIGLALSEAVRIVATSRDVVVIVDQLDALANLVDLTSSRLNEIIDFVRDCSGIERVSVICSCREFEFRHDTRFVAIEADSLSLALPPWEQIVTELEKAGVVNADNWPSSFREILRVPQHLRIYLDRFKTTGNADPFRSYQNMLDDLWERTLTTEPQRTVVYRLAEHLIETESLWAPMVRFESEVDVIGELDAAQFLQRQDGQLGFRHQTLLEHAKARLFTKQGHSLCDHVIARQDAILVRPTLWAVLGYLRGADRPKYHEELDALFRSQLRLHVRYLLIDFLGQVTHPDEQEIAHLAARLVETDDRIRVLVAIRGQENWFRAFHASHFPTVMRWENAEQWPMVGVLSSAWKFGRDEVLKLITDYWFPDASKDRLTWNTLREIDRWDERTVNMVCETIRRAEGDEDRLWWAEDLVYRVSADQPALAPRVFLAAVSRNTTRTVPETSARHGLLRSPLENTNAWYELPAVAEAAPIEFLRTAWLWFVQTANKLHDGARSTVLNQYSGYLSVLDPESDHPTAPITASILIAVEETAKRDPNVFVEITRAARAVENMPVQQIIARGFVAAASTMPSLALGFLCEDDRRFMLGSYGTNNQGDSLALISAIAPYLDRVQAQTLESAILNSSQYRRGVAVIEDQREWDREARLRLMHAIPRNLLSDATKSFIDDEERALPNWNDKPEGVRSGRVRVIPPLTKEQMASASDEEVLKVLRGPQENDRDAREWIEDELGWTQRGGARSAAQELGQLAKDNPNRVLALLLKMQAEGNEVATAEVLRSLADVQLDSSAVFELMVDLERLNPVSAEIRSQAGYLLYKHCCKGTGLPNSVCDVLERWLKRPWNTENDEFGKSSDDGQVEPESDHPVSVLWDRDLGRFESDSALWPLLAVTNGLLMRQTPDTLRWLHLLGELVHTDIATSTWVHYCRELRWIRLQGTDLDVASSVIRHLLERYPAIRTTKEGSRFLAETSDLLPADLVQEFLESLEHSERLIHRQTFGELLTVIALRDNHHTWALAKLEEQLLAIEATPDKAEAIATGIAFAAAHFWDAPHSRADSGRILCRLMNHTTAKVGYAISTVFWAAETFPADEVTNNLLESIARCEAVLAGRFLPELIEHLAFLLPHLRQRVLEVCHAIVTRRGPEMTSLSYELFASGTHLVNVAMTLQRFPDTRADGLSFLESLLRLGLDDAYAILNDIDIRPAVARRVEPQKRRTRRRKA